jgi:hypothetical protein
MPASCATASGQSFLENSRRPPDQKVNVLKIFKMNIYSISYSYFDSELEYFNRTYPVVLRKSGPL